MGSQWEILCATEFIECECSWGHGVQRLRAWGVRHGVSVHGGLARVVILVGFELGPAFGLEALLLGIFLALLGAREAAVHGESDVDHHDSQHRARACEASFRLFAVSNIVLVVRHVTILGDVPGGAGLLVIRVCGVAAGLVVDGDNPENEDTRVDDGGEDRRKDVEHVHDGLDEHDEHG